MGHGIYSATSGAIAQATYLDVIANNLANSETVGFKADDVTFGDFFVNAQSRRGVQNFLQEEEAPLSTNLATRHQGYVTISQPYTDLSAGAKRYTGGSLDLAIQGEGYFKVQLGDNTFYTRDGRLHVDADGELAIASGAKLLDGGGNPVRVPAGDLAINEEGTILSKGSQVGQLATYTLPNTKAIEKAGSTLLRYNDTAQPAVVSAKSQVMEGYLEQSNVNPMREMTRMIQVNRSFEIMNKVIKSFRDLDGQAVSEIGGQKTA